MCIYCQSKISGNIFTAQVKELFDHPLYSNKNRNTMMCTLYHVTTYFLAFATIKTLEDLSEENIGKNFYNYLYIFFVLQDVVVCMMLGNSFFENLELHLSEFI